MIKKQTEDFLKSHQMHHSQIDDQVLISSFHSEMKVALKGESSSLGMYSSFIDMDKPIKKNKITAVDAGGTHYRVALIATDFNGKIAIEKMDVFPMIGTQASYDKDGFFLAFAQLMLPYAIVSDAIGISFAFPGLITADKDLLISSMAKEIQVAPIENESLKTNLNKAFLELANRSFEITIVNDGVASLIGTVFGQNIYAYDALIGGIVGTGTNTCYRELCSNVIKTKYPAGRKFDLINVESGCFSKYAGGTFDKFLDDSSKIPNDHLFEKMIGGKYLGELTSLICKAASQQGLIYKDYPKEQMKFADAKEVDEFINKAPQNNDELVIREIALNVIKRAAKLFSLSIIAPIMLNEEYKHMVYIALEGSTVQKSNTFKEEIKQVLSSHLKNTHIEIDSNDNSVILGAALSVLM